MPPIHLALLRRTVGSSSRAIVKSSRPPAPAALARISPFTRSYSSSFHPTNTSSRPPVSTDRGPASEENTVSDFSNLDVLGGTPVPSTAIDACLWDGFHLNNGVKITNGSGVLLVAGEAFAWKPWNAARIAPEGERKTDGKTTAKADVGPGMGNKRLVNDRGVFEVGPEAWSVLGLVWPKPDLLILGVGPNMMPLSPATRQAINSLGIQIEIQDTRNAAAQFNLLATERGVGSVAAAMIPLGWKEGVGVVSRRN